jgi:hypothetical protein
VRVSPYFSMMPLLLPWVCGYSAVDETGLSEGTRWYVRLAVPAAAVLLTIAFFLSVLSRDAIHRDRAASRPGQVVDGGASEGPSQPSR